LDQQDDIASRSWKTSQLFIKPEAGRFTARYWHGPGAAGPAVLDVLDYVNAMLVVRGAGRILDGSTWRW
jgi:hypothetical protein